MSDNRINIRGIKTCSEYVTTSVDIFELLENIKYEILGISNDRDRETYFIGTHGDLYRSEEDTYGHTYNTRVRTLDSSTIYAYEDVENLRKYFQNRSNNNE